MKARLFRLPDFFDFPTKKLSLPHNSQGVPCFGITKNELQSVFNQTERQAEIKPREPPAP
jgi:hypothetical protein